MGTQLKQSLSLRKITGLVLMMILCLGVSFAGDVNLKVVFLEDDNYLIEQSSNIIIMTDKFHNKQTILELSNATDFSDPGESYDAEITLSDGSKVTGKAFVGHDFEHKFGIQKKYVSYSYQVGEETKSKAVRVISIPSTKAPEMNLLFEFYGKMIDFDLEEKPKMQDGDTMIPFEKFFKGMDYQVEIGEKTATASNHRLALSFTLNSNEITVEDKEAETKKTVKAEKSLQKIEGVWMMPFESVAAATEFKYIYDEKNRAIYLDGIGNTSGTRSFVNGVELKAAEILEKDISKAKNQFEVGTVKADADKLYSFATVAEIKTNAAGKSYDYYLYGFMDKTGQVVIEPQFILPAQFKNGFLLHSKIDRSGEKAKFISALLNTKGEIALGYDYSSMNQLDAGVLLVRDKNDQQFYYDQSGKLLAMSKYVKLFSVVEDKAVAEIKVDNGRRQVVVDFDGEMLYSHMYYDVYQIVDQGAHYIFKDKRAGTDYNKGLMNKDGKIVLPAIYQSIDHVIGALYKLETGEETIYKYLDGSSKYKAIREESKICKVYDLVNDENQLVTRVEDLAGKEILTTPYELKDIYDDRYLVIERVYDYNKDTSLEGFIQGKINYDNLMYTIYDLKEKKYIDVPKGALDYLHDGYFILDKKDEKYVGIIHINGQIVKPGTAKAETKDPVAEVTKVDVAKSAKDIFSDLDESHKDYAGISFCFDNKIVSGSDGLMKPNGTLSRGAGAKIFVESLGLKEIDSKESTYKDTGSQWYENYAKVARDNGIINGYEDGAIFKGENSMTVAEVVKIIVNVTQLQVTGEEKTIFDAEFHRATIAGEYINNWADGEARYLFDKKVISEELYKNLIENPELGATRGMIMTTIHEAYQKGVLKLEL